MKRSEISDAEFGGRLVRMYDNVAALHRAGGCDAHPSEVVNKWAADLRAARDAASAEIEKRDQPTRDQDPSDPADPSVNGDDPADFPGKPAGPARNGASVERGATDGAIDVDLARAVMRGPRRGR